MATSSKETRQRIVWMWKSNVDPWNNVEPNEWKRYSDIENRMIELAYQQHQNQVELDDFLVDFTRQVQINKKKNRTSEDQSNESRTCQTNMAAHISKRYQ